MNEAEYRNILRAPERALKQMLLDFRFFREDVPGFLVFAQESRLKSYQSAMTKARQREVDVAELPDLAGARIVVGTSQEVDVVRRFFTRKQHSNDLVVESDEAISREDGYRSRHLIVVYPPSYVRSASAARVEIQVPTIFQYAFNNLSRSWIYKSSRPLSSTWKQRFTSVSDQLDALNSSASALYSEVVESANGGDPDAPLTPFSLQLIVRSEFDELVELDDAVDSVTFVAEWAHVTTNGQFRAFLQNEQLGTLWDEVRELRKQGGAGVPSIPDSRWVFHLGYFRVPHLAAASIDAARAGLAPTARSP